MKKNNSVQSNYVRYYILYIIAPILIVFVGAIGAIYYFATEEIESRSMLVVKQIEDSLNRELSNNALDFSRLLLANNNQFLYNSGRYVRGDNKEKYYYSERLTEQYNQMFLSETKVIGLQIYYDAGQTYYIRSAVNLEMEDLKSYHFYNQAKSAPDIVGVGIVDEYNLYYSVAMGASDKLMAYYISPDKKDVLDEVDIVLMYALSPSLDSIKTASEWSEGISVYLFDNGEVLEASDDSYIDEALSFIRDNATDKQKNNRQRVKIQATTIDKTGWDLVVVSTNTQFAEIYRDILILAFLVLLCVFVLFNWFITRLLKNVIQPINHISKTMNKIKKNNVFEKVKIKGPDEIITIGDTYNQMIDKIQNLMDENIEKEREKKEEEILALEAQINPHFLSNTVNAIQFMAKVARFQNIENMANSMNKILAVTFRNKDTMQKLGEELEILQAYIYIMQIRYANSFKVVFDIPKDYENYEVPKLILQPFVENAIIHGFSECEEVGEIRISVTKVKNDLHIHILDNGIGMDQQKIEEVLHKKPVNGKKIAVANINKRLELYYGKHYKVNIVSEIGKSTLIAIKIPLNTQ